MKTCVAELKLVTVYSCFMIVWGTVKTAAYWPWESVQNTIPLTEETDSTVSKKTTKPLYTLTYDREMLKYLRYVLLHY